MKKNKYLGFIAGILAVVCYLVFALIAFSRYQLPYSPMKNWLSDLGSAELNPDGAIYYNIGIISSALFLIVFFLGLSVWKIDDNKAQIIMLRLTQAFGILGSFCMLMSAIYPINFYAVHSFWSTSLYVLLSTAFIFSAAALRYHPRVPRWLLILGVSTGVLVILTSIFPSAYVLEWITLFLFLSYVIFVSLETKRQQS